MTPVEEAYLRNRINTRIAELCGQGDLHFIIKRGVYYRENAHGYTTSQAEAWRLPYEEAKKHEYLRGEDPVALAKCPPPNYLESLDACTVFEAQATHDLYEHYLGEVTGTSALALRRAFVGERYNLATAVPWQRCKAFLMLHKEWDLLQDAREIFDGTTN